MLMTFQVFLVRAQAIFSTYAACTRRGGGILKYFYRCVACSDNAIQFMKQFFFASKFRNNFIEKKSFVLI